jgi:DNA repair protein RecN (Recombination protein N)
MLKQLKIDQFVIIDHSEMSFRDKLTIFTGETGAGKSIILGAMEHILGSEAKLKAIRQGHNESVFEATFAPIKENPVWQSLIERQLVSPADTEFTIHRTIQHDGPDSIQLNGKNIDLEFLKEIGEHLIEVHGQHANQSLLGPENQLNLLDRFGNFDQQYYDNVSTALDDVHRYTKELEEEKLFLVKHKGKKGQQLINIYKKFESIGMKEGFYLEVKEQYDELMTAKNTLETFQDIMGRFVAANGILGGLSGAKKTLESQNNLDQDKIINLGKYLSDSLTNARNAVAEISTILPEYEIDLDPLIKLKEILAVMQQIIDEAKITFDDVESFFKQVQTKVHRIQNGRERIAEINDLLAGAKNRYREHAHILTDLRMKAAQKMSEAITSEFVPLMLNKAEFQIAVIEQPEMTWTPIGFNEVTFKARMNPGMPFSPISETASGGEMARMILALKVVIQRSQTTSTLVFDEVDVGIGGAAAAAVGNRIAALANLVQVIVITHSPQVASRGNQHLHISKRVEGEKTISSVNELSEQQRTEEISRMLAGGELTNESLAAAQSLINEAQQNAASVASQMAS